MPTMKIVLGTMNNFNQQGLPVSACAGTAQATAAGIAGTAVERSLDDNVQQSTISNEPTRTSGTFSGAGFQNNGDFLHNARGTWVGQQDQHD